MSNTCPIERRPDGRYSLIYDGSNNEGWQRPWGLDAHQCTVNKGPLTPQEAFDADSDWSVSYDTMATASGLAVDGYRAVTAQRPWGNTFLGIVGMRHTHIQNDEVFSLLDDSGLKVDAAAVLDDGRELYCQARIGEDSITLANGKKDVLQQYLTLRWGHCGQTALVVGWSGTRVVCSNTLARATLQARQSEEQGEEGSGKIKHTQSAEAKMVDLKVNIVKASEARRSLIVSYQVMAKKKATPELIASTIAVAFPNKALDSGVAGEDSTTGMTRTLNVRNRVTAILANGEHNTPQDGSVWALWQAITAFQSHESIVRGLKGSDAQASRWLRSTIDGDKPTELAYNYLVRA